MLIDNLLNSFHSKPFWKQDYQITDSNNKEYYLAIIINIVKSKVDKHQYTYHLKMRLELTSSGGQRTPLERIGIVNKIFILDEINESCQNVLLKYNNEKESHDDIEMIYENEINKYVINPIKLMGLKIIKK